MDVLIDRAMVIHMPRVDTMPGYFPHYSHGKEAVLHRLVADLFRKGGWKVLQQPGSAKDRPDLLIEQGGQKYVVEIKRSSEGRRDRLIPLAAQAILEARSMAHRAPGQPKSLAIVAADYISESAAEQVAEFARQHAPDVAVGVIDLDGLRSFEGQCFEHLNAGHEEGRLRNVLSRGPAAPQLFSDLNQWMLKVLLAPSIPGHYLAAPRGQYEGASQLAGAAGVSVMSAFRFVDQFASEGFLGEGKGGLRLVRKMELMDRWLAASHRRVAEIPARFVLHKGKSALREALRSYSAPEGPLPNKSRKPDREPARRPRVCLGLFAAAEALDLGFVHGVSPYLYIERAEQNALESLGLSVNGVESDADVYIRVPRNRESVFRGSVWIDGVPASDVVQAWLDVSQHPARGREQADLIWRKILRAAILDKDGK
jgi:hypothetical protein